MVLGKSDPLWLGASCSDIVFLEPPNPVVGKLTAATQKGTPSLGVVWGEGGMEVDSLRVPNPRRQLDKHCSVLTQGKLHKLANHPTESIHSQS